VEKQPHVVGPESHAEFQLHSTAAPVEAKGFGYVAFSSLFSASDYRVVSPLKGFAGATSINNLTIRLSGEYWFNPRWGLAAGAENTFFTFMQGSYNRKNIELQAKRKLKWGNWDVLPKAGPELREFFLLTPDPLGGTSSPIQSTDFWVHGLGVGVDFRSQFTDALSLGIKVSYFLPLLATDTDGGTLSGDSSYRNFSVGAQGIYWLGQGWACGLGGFLDNRSISYTPSGRTRSEQVYMDALYAFGSIIRTF
jgi:hypothetical protein